MTSLDMFVESYQFALEVLELQCLAIFWVTRIDTIASFVSWVFKNHDLNFEHFKNQENWENLENVVIECFEHFENWLVVLALGAFMSNLGLDAFESCLNFFIMFMGHLSRTICTLDLISV